MNIEEIEPSDLRRAIEWSEWSESAAVLAHRYYIESVALAWRPLLERAGVDPVVGGVDDLPSSSLLRLIVAPEICRQLMKATGREATAEFLSDVIQVERILVGLPSEQIGSRPRWSAIGDVFLVGSSVCHIAPEIVPGLRVDAFSPYVQRSMSRKVSIPYSAHHESRVCDKSREAIQVLETTCPWAARFVRETTVIVSACPDDNAPLHFTSGSSRATIGRITLVNAHLEAVGLDVLVNAFIHEAIHSWLYKLEFRYPLVRDFADGWRSKVTSPWTGSSLRLTTYLHACFVYYGLLRWWLRPEVARLFDEAVISKQIRALATGFRDNDSRLDTLKASRLWPGLWNEVCEMNSIAQSFLEST